MMEAAVTTAAVRRAKLQSNRRHRQTNTQLFTGRMPFLLPNRVRAVKLILGAQLLRFTGTLMCNGRSYIHIYN